MGYGRTYLPNSVLDINLHDSYCLCDLSRDKKLDSFSVVILKEILRYFEVPFASRYRKKNLVVNLSTFLEECECHR